MSERITRLKCRYDDAKKRGMTWQNQFEDIYDYFMPNRNIAHQSAVGEKHNVHLYDSTGILAVRSFVAALHTGLTPPGLQWLELEPGSEIKETEPGYDQLKEQLKETTDLIFEFVETSNFKLAINEAYYDLAVGTGALVINEGTVDNPLLFSAVPLLRIYPEEGISGDIETVWRDFRKFPVRNITRTWPTAKLSSGLSTMLETNPNAKVDLIEGTVFEPKRKIWEYIVLEQRTNSIIVDHRLRSTPWIVFRAFKRADEVYGRGPADQALPTMTSLNQVMADELKAGTLRSNPIFMGAGDGIFNPHTINLEPWSIIPISPSSMGQLPLAPVPMGGDPKFGQVQAEQLREMINKIFFAQPLGPLDPNSSLTATEILLRNQEQLEQKIPFIGRLQFELLDKLTQRIVFILKKKGLIPNIVIDGKEVTVKYKSPLIQTQGLQNVNRAVQLAQTTQSIFGPQLSLLGLNSDEWFEYLAENLDVDPKLVKSAQELEVLGEQASQAAQQQPQLPAAPMGGLPQGQPPQGALPQPQQQQPMGG